jgi:glycine/D-amino acid oxidase-like deaminating enzyme
MQKLAYIGHNTEKKGGVCMDLLSGNPYWQTTVAKPPVYPSLEEDIECDVLIIGGGSSGAQCAYYLCEQGLDVVVVDKRKAGHGSTIVNTSLIQYLGDKLFYELVNTFGEEKTVRHYKLCEQAITDIEEAAKKLPINAEFIRRDSLYYASYEEDITKINKDYFYMQKHGFEAEILSEDQIEKDYGFKKRMAMLIKNDAELNPYSFTLGLLEYGKQHGVRMFEETEIVGQKLEKDEAVFFTKNKSQIKAKHVIMAGGYENQEFKREKKAVLTSSYAIVTTPVKDFKGWKNRNLIWETARPYIYMRTTSDNRVIIGGLDESTIVPQERDAKLVHKRDKLLKEFNKLFPHLQVEADYYISAYYGGTHDGLPLIGIYDEMPNCYFLSGYGDNGTVYNMVLAKIIAEHITTKKSSDLELYIQTRKV